MSSRSRSRGVRGRRSPKPTASRPEVWSDAELVSRCSEGDPAAWRALVSRYRGLVYGIPRRMGLDAADADDVFQITFTRLAQRIGSLSRPSRVRAWLVTTSRRVALNTKTRARDTDSEALEHLADPAALPEQELEELQHRQLVQQAVTTLDARCRGLLRALYYPKDGLDGTASYESVALELGIPVGSIGPTRKRCLGKLLHVFQQLSEATGEAGA